MGSTVFDWKSEVHDAAERILPHVRHTPLDHSPVLSERHSCNVYIKLENEQVTGAFKARGAFNKLLKMKEQGLLHPDSRPICASSGNHALGCSLATKFLGLTCQAYVPTKLDPGKESTMERMGADVVKRGYEWCSDAEMAAKKAAQEEGRPYIPPCNDLDVAAGQGTIGVEIFTDLPAVDVVFVPVGGGALMAGVASYLKAVKPSVKIVGCQPVNSRVMYESVKAGQLIDVECEPTLSEGTAGGVNEDTVTFEVCRDLVDEWVLVDEDSIIDGVYFMAEHHHKMVEGTSGVPVAAFIKTAAQYEGKNVVMIATGGNICIETFKHILNKQ